MLRSTTHANVDRLGLTGRRTDCDPTVANLGLPRNFGLVPVC